jgi:haloacetate dehalogenase
MTELDHLFPGFAQCRVHGGDGEIFVRTGGNGPPVLLLHGYPETHAMWHDLAPALARNHSVVVADLRGYGRSFIPTRATGGETMSKRALAADMVGVMAKLGHARFAVVGHDRGARVAYRMALDHQTCVARLMLLDVITSHDIWTSLDLRNAMRMWHWTFLAQPYPFPERWIASDPAGWVDERFKRGQANLPLWLEPAAIEDYRRMFADPARVAATCDDYRAGAGVDVTHDAHDLAQRRKIQCPTRLLWGKRGNLSDQKDPLALWAKWVAGPLSGAAIDCGHFIPEENAAATLREVTAFLSADPTAPHSVP